MITHSTSAAKKPQIIGCCCGHSLAKTNDLWIHDEKDKTKANLIARFFDTSFNDVNFSRPFGVIYADERPVYEENMVA